MYDLLAFGGIKLRKIAVAVGVGGIELRRAGNDFIQFAAVEPYAPALEAIVYLDTVALSGLQRYFTEWAEHSCSVMSDELCWQPQPFEVAAQQFPIFFCSLFQIG